MALRRITFDIENTPSFNKQTPRYDLFIRSEDGEVCYTNCEASKVQRITREMIATAIDSL
jgi:hypothetical protein